MDAKKGIPENSSIVMPRLFCRDAAAEMEFCSHTFGALELNRRPGPDGKVAHGLMAISGEMIMIEAEWPSFPRARRSSMGSSPVGIFVYVDDVDQVVERAVSAGAKILYPVQNQFLGRPNGMDHGPTGTYRRQLLHVLRKLPRNNATSDGQRTWKNRERSISTACSCRVPRRLFSIRL